MQDFSKKWQILKSSEVFWGKGIVTASTKIDERISARASTVISATIIVPIVIAITIVITSITIHNYSP